MKSRTLKQYFTNLAPLREKPCQVYLGTEVHLAGLLSWILDQTGTATVTVTTFSTSDDFLSAFWRLKQDGKISFARLIADFKASRKTLRLATLMRNAFDEVYFAENHSKLMLVGNDEWHVTVISSQNQTYGGRIESSAISTDDEIFSYMEEKLEDIITNKSASMKEWIPNR